MLFNSLEYLVLLAVSLVLYWLVPSVRVRQGLLLAASVAFYVSWSAVFIVLLAVAIGINWGLGVLMEKGVGRLAVWLACVLNLGLLAYFKYAQFFVDNVAWGLNALKLSMQTPHWSIILPLGISFYVFELISYVVDVYQRKIPHERNPFTFALFILFFPHLIAGPICRAGQFIPQLKTLQPFKLSLLYDGAFMILGGFVLKSCIADRLALYVDVVFKQPAAYSGLDNVLAMIGFGTQILGDFWGYSLMGVGSALMFGYTLPSNFNLPYHATSIKEFWRRWHITLSSWLRDYLFIALGGSRGVGKAVIYRNLALTMLLGGLWHGANWTFIVWGALHGVALAVNRWFSESHLPRGLKRVFQAPPVAYALTMGVVFLAWVFFRARNVGDAMTMIGAMVRPAPGWGVVHMGVPFFEALVLFVPLHLLIHRYTYDRTVSAAPAWVGHLSFPLLASLAVLYYVNGGQFIYFQF